jgi:hypothetical protein
MKIADFDGHGELVMDDVKRHFILVRDHDVIASRVMIGTRITVNLWGNSKPTRFGIL